MLWVCAVSQLLLKHTYCSIDPAVCEAVKRWDQYLIATNRKTGTRRVYLAALSRYIELIDYVFAPSQGSIFQWVKARRTTLAVGSFNQELSAVRSFYRFAHHWELTPTDYSKQLPQSHRAPKRLVRYLDEWQMGQLMAAPDLSTFVGFRDHVIIRLLYETGLRASEVVALELGDLFDDHTIHVRNGKGGIGRYIVHSAALTGLFGQWYKLRRTVRPGKRAALFVTQRGKPLANGNSIWIIVNRYARKSLGLARGFEKITQTGKHKPWQGHYPHLLRAAFATAMLQNGCDIRSIQELLGHADPSTTARYLGVDMDLLKSEHAKLPRSSFGC